MTAIKGSLVLLSMIFLITACGSPQQAPTTAPTDPPPAPTRTSPPPMATSTVTNTPQPTATATTAPTETPVGQIFHEGFSGTLQPGWTWMNENLARWAITPEGWLQIIGEDPSLLADGSQNNLLCRQLPDGDFMITVAVQADPNLNFQQATLYLYQDGNNFIAINRGFCSFCSIGGSGIFMDYMIAGTSGSYSTKTLDMDVFLRLVKQGDTITGYYALEADAWQRFGSVGNFLKDNNLCIGVSNVDRFGQSADLVGRFDFLEISLP